MKRLWISVIAVCAVTPAAVSQSRPAIQASTSTTRPAAGRWHYWTRCDRGSVVAHETGGLWFKADKLLWRYDLKTGEIRSLSPVHDISAITGPNALVPANDYAGVSPLFFAGRVFLPGRGWIEDPRFRSSSDPERYLLDPKGDLVLKGFSPGRPAPVYWYARSWHMGVTLPSSGGFLPLADGYLLYGTGSRGEGVPIFYDLQGKPKSASPVGGASFFRRTYRVGNKTYAVFLKGMNIEQQILYDATSGRLVEKARGDTVGPDLIGKGFLTGTQTLRKGYFRKLQITLPDGSVIETPLLRGIMSRPRLCRDANGHVWLNAYRWNGKRWDLVVPREHHFPLGNTRKAMSPRLVRLDDKGRTWIEKPKAAAPSPDVFAFDSASKTGWTLERFDKPPYMLRLHRFADGKRKTLVTFPTPSPYRPDFIRDEQGQWWWMGYNKATATRRVSGPRYEGVVRLSGVDAHFYPTRRRPNSGFPGYLFYGASKRIWLCDADGWSFWDASTDKFVPGEPWKEFAFAFGPWTLSLVASRGDLRPLPALGQPHNVSSLRRKKGDAWPYLADPFGRGELLGTAGMIWKDRMLVRSRHAGILEYDVTRDRWVLLHSWPRFDAFFDPVGRRMLVCDEYILSYDGDPFGDPLAAAAAKEIAEFRKLLKLMDDRRWLVREQATQEMKKVVQKHAQRLRAALRGAQISEEVRARIKWVLRETGLDKDTPPKPGKSLFYQMHPLPELKSVPLPRKK